MKKPLEKFQPFDCLILENGEEYFVEKDDGGETIHCYVGDFDDVCDATIYGMGIALTDIARKDVVDYEEYLKSMVITRGNETFSSMEEYWEKYGDETK